MDTSLKCKQMCAVHSMTVFCKSKSVKNKDGTVTAFYLVSERLWSHIYLSFNHRTYSGKFVNYKFHDHFELESQLV